MTQEEWMKEAERLLEDYVGACTETAVFNATQRSGMTVRMAKPRRKALLAHLQQRPLTGREVAGWIPVGERLPEVGTDCLIWTRPSWAKGPYAQVDRWDEQHECPVSWSTATIPIGPGWDGAEFDDVTHWMPLHSAPSPDKEEATGDGGVKTSVSPSAGEPSQ